MKVKFLFSCTLTILTNFSYSQTKDGLKQKIVNLLDEQKLSGAVWATVSDKGEIFTDVHGYKNTATKKLMSPTDKVHVGSVSKTILAAGFLRMATLELIKLDDAVKNYLPNLPLDNQWDKTNPVTVKQLLDHTSGLTDAKLWHVFSTTATPDTPLESVYIDDPSILKIQSKPGSVYSYSNLGYTILGMIIEKITQKRYENYLDENLLKPLGMVNSSFEFVTQVGDNADKQLALGHFDNGEPVFAMPMYLRPAGQFTTTAEDMGIFLRFMMSDGTINGNPFIKTDYLTSVGNQKQTDAYENGIPYGDALGAYSRDRYGVVGIAKNGNILGFAAMIYMFPTYKKAFFISHNMDSETANYDLFNEALVKHLDMPTKNYVTKRQQTESEIKKWNGYYVPVVTKVEPFGLIDYVFSHTKVATLKSGASLEPAQGKMKELLYQGNFLFSMNDRTNISHAFYKNESGDLLITDGIRTIKKVNGLTIITITTILLLGLVGMIYVFISGIVTLIKLRTNFIRHSNFGIFLSILAVFISFGFIANQPFIRMGDKTVGNIILAFGSLLMPLLSVMSLVLIIKSKKRFVCTTNFWAVLFVIQFCILLLVNKLMPVIMWR